MLNKYWSTEIVNWPMRARCLQVHLLRKVVQKRAIFRCIFLLKRTVFFSLRISSKRLGETWWGFTGTPPEPSGPEPWNTKKQIAREHISELCARSLETSGSFKSTHSSPFTLTYSKLPWWCATPDTVFLRYFLRTRYALLYALCHSRHFCADFPRQSWWHTRLHSESLLRTRCRNNWNRIWPFALENDSAM